MSVVLMHSVIPIFTFFFCGGNRDSTPTQTVTSSENIQAKEYRLSDQIAWSDEFNLHGAPDEKIWGFDLGGNGWGNNEKEVYTKDLKNAKVKNGCLYITALYDAKNKSYTSARLKTKGNKDFLYGKIEVRAKLPKGKGTWPAIWALASQSNYGTGLWPDNGEIDIMEHVGFDQGRIHHNIHTKAFNHILGTNKGNNRLVGNVSDSFHVYSLEWLPNRITMLIDGQKNFEFIREDWYTWEEWPFDKPEHLLLNVAIGGNWGGKQGIDDRIFPQAMIVDYVRYYEAVKK